MARDVVAELDGTGTGRVATRAGRQPSSGQSLQAVDEQPKVRLIHSHQRSVRSGRGPLRAANGVRSIGPLAARLTGGAGTRDSPAVHTFRTTRAALGQQPSTRVSLA
jgi:hypothetical protein